MPKEIQFNRTPYKVTYYKDGEKKVIRRIPPPKLHQMLPKDIVELTRQKNADWEEGESYTVKHISTRQPNTLQLMNEDGDTTFVSHYDLELEEALGYRGGRPDRIDDPEKNKYLLWP